MEKRYVVLEVRRCDGRQRVIRSFVSRAAARRCRDEYCARGEEAFDFCIEVETDEALPPPPTERLCQGCSTVLPVSAFHQSKGRPAGRCKACRKAYAEENYWTLMAYRLLRISPGDVTADQLRERFEGAPVCHLCDLPIGRDDFSVDHLIPVSRGGRSEINNLKAAHKRCNYIKGTMTTEEAMTHRHDTRMT